MLVWRGERGSLSSSVSVSPCVTLTPLVIHKAEMVALSQEMWLSNAPDLAATECIQICVGLESREKTRAPIYSNGRYTLMDACFFCPGKSPSTHPLPCPPLPLGHSETGQARAREPLRSWILSVPLLGAQPINGAREMLSQIRAS